MNRQITGAAVLGLVLVGVAWVLTGGGAHLKGQLELSAGDADTGGGIKTGMSPEAYGAPCPSSSVQNKLWGPHPIKRHPRRCSPGMSAAMERNLDWMFCPPSEEDL